MTDNMFEIETTALAHVACAPQESAILLTDCIHQHGTIFVFCSILAISALLAKNGETRGKTNEIKSKLACILEASESTRMRMEESLPNNHKDHIAGKGCNSLQHYNLVHKFIPMLQAMKIPAVKAAVEKECEKLEKIPAWDLTKVRT